MKTNKITHIIYLTIIALLLAGSIFGYYYSQNSLKTNKGTPISADILSRLEDKPPIQHTTIKTSNLKEYVAIIDSLKEPLSQYNERPCTHHTEGTYKQNIYLIDENKNQVVVGHSCGSMGYDSSILVKTEDGNWHKIGAKGFIFTIDDNDAEYSQERSMPSCKTTEKYKLTSYIAPVCYDNRDNIKTR